MLKGAGVSAVVYDVATGGALKVVGSGEVLAAGCLVSGRRWGEGSRIGEMHARFVSAGEM